MQNNDIFRRIRYALDLRDSKVVEIFGNVNKKVTEGQVRYWLLRDDNTSFVKLSDLELSAFLNGLIVSRRGLKGDSPPEAEELLTNNIIFKKLRIALELHADGILEMLILAGFTFSRHELSSLFRRPDHKNYRECSDQLLKKFLKGMQLKYRPAVEEEVVTGE